MGIRVQKSETRRRLALAAVLLTVFMLTACKSKHHEGGKDSSPSPSPVALATVDVAKVASRVIPQVLSLVGSITANDPVNLDPRVAGRVVEVFADVGDTLRKGQPILRLDDTDIRLQMMQDEAALRQALAKVGLTSPDQKLTNKNNVPGVKKALSMMEYQKQNYERYKSLREQELVSDNDLANALQQYLSAKADYEASLEQVDQDLQAVKMAEAKLAQDKQQLEYTVVTSPLDGMVQQRNVSRGDLMQSGQVAFVVVDVKDMFMLVDVPETWVPKVGLGKVFEAVTETVPKMDVKARIIEISPTLNTQTRTLQVKARVENPPAGLRPGMFAKVQFFTGSRQQRMLVPQAAVLSQAGVSRVFVVRQAGGGHEVHDTVVEAGDTLGDWMEVSGDLHPGDTVAASNLAALKDKQPVALGKTLAPPAVAQTR